MSKRNYFFFLMVVCFLLTACQKETTETATLEQQEEKEETDIFAAQRLEIQELENLWNTEGLKPEEYYQLADLYQTVGDIKKARNLLEQCYRLFFEESTLEKMAALVVNVDEEEENTANELKFLMESLGDIALIGDSLAEIQTEEFFAKLLPKMRGVGSRQYYYAKENGDLYYLQVGYNEKSPFLKASLKKKDQKLAEVNYREGQLQFFEGAYDGNQRQGEFSLWYVDARSGIITKEEGTLKNQKLSGLYKLSWYQKKEKDLGSLWQGREDYSYQVFEGDFDDSGKTKLEQPAKKGYENSLVYAYDEDKKICLFLPKEEVEGEAFGESFLKLDNMPEFSTYQINITKEETIQEENAVARNEIKVRIYDGMVQWYDGKKWNDVETVGAMAEKDIFNISVPEVSAETSEDNKENEEEEKTKEEISLGKEISMGSATESKGSGAQSVTVRQDANGQIIVTVEQPPAKKPVPGTNPGTPTVDYSDSGNSSGGNSGGGNNSGSNNGGSQNPSTPTPSTPSTPDPPPSNDPPPSYDPPSDSGGDGGGDSGGDTIGEFSGEVD